MKIAVVEVISKLEPNPPTEVGIRVMAVSPAVYAMLQCWYA